MLVKFANINPNSIKTTRPNLTSQEKSDMSRNEALIITGKQVNPLELYTIAREVCSKGHRIFHSNAEAWNNISPKELQEHGFFSASRILTLGLLGMQPRGTLQPVVPIRSHPGNPSFILRLFEELGINPTNYHHLVAINSSLGVRIAQAQDIAPKQVERIRQEYRRILGITGEQEGQAVYAIVNSEIKDNLMIVWLPHNREEAVLDRVCATKKGLSSLEKGGFGLLIITTRPDIKSKPNGPYAASFFGGHWVSRSLRVKFPSSDSPLRPADIPDAEHWHGNQVDPLSVIKFIRHNMPKHNLF
jgi:hypothetical protein